MDNNRDVDPDSNLYMRQPFLDGRNDVHSVEMGLR